MALTSTEQFCFTAIRWFYSIHWKFPLTLNKKLHTIIFHCTFKSCRRFFIFAQFVLLSVSFYSALVALFLKKLPYPIPLGRIETMIQILFTGILMSISIFTFLLFANVAKINHVISAIMKLAASFNSSKRTLRLWHIILTLYRSNIHHIYFR